MKKRTLKKLVTGMAIGLLFSTTAVFGATSQYYSISLNVSQTAYSSLCEKQVNGSSKIGQQSPEAVIEYRVVNSIGTAKSNSVTITNIDTKYASYYSGVVAGDYLKLSAYNNPAKNQGKVRVAKGYWTP